MIGINVGLAFTYAGRLATLLWRQLVAVRGARPAGGGFVRLEPSTVPAGLVAGVVMLWLVNR